MSVQCRVKPIETSRWKIYGSDSPGPLGSKSFSTAWNREAVRLLQHSHLEQIMPLLENIVSVKVSKTGLKSICFM